jgi:dihydropyrimidinase
MVTAVRGGIIVTSTDQYNADILIEGEKIAAIGKNLSYRADAVIDATGKYVFPGGVDGHTHFKAPFMGTVTTGFETTVGAIIGGTTTVIDFVPQSEGAGLVDSIIRHREESAEGKSVVDFGLHATVMDSRNSIFEEAPNLIKEGVPTLKVFMAYKGTPAYSSDETIFRLLRKAKDIGMLVMVHAEHADIIEVLRKQMMTEGKTEPKYHAMSRPPVAEAEATFRATMLAKAAEAPIFVVHVSCYDSMLRLRGARMEGISAFGETCPHYLILGVENLSRPDFEGAKYVCSPPLREAWNQEKLWEAVRNGWIQVVGSDHCGFNFKGQKELGRDDFTKIPNGCPGVENRLGLLYTYGVMAGRLSLGKMVDVFATTPAKIYGMYPQKGGLVVGGDADIVIFDPDWTGVISVKTSHQGLDFNPFEGLTQKGRVEKVLLRGTLSVDAASFVGNPGQGRFIKREPYGLAYAVSYAK